jgi:zinc transporter ZupT
MDVLPIVLSAIIAFLATLSAGIFIKKLQKRIGIVCAFSSGFFIALSMFNLLPEMLAMAPKTQVPMENLFLASLTGFFLLFAVEQVLLKFNPKNMAKNVFKPKIGLASTLEFCSHAFLEGVAIGVGFQLQFSLGVFVAFAVISHDFCDGVSTLALMLNSGNSLKTSFSMLIVDASAPVLGAVSTLVFLFNGPFLLYALSFLIGSFLFIGGGMLLPDAYKMNRKVVTVGFFFLGFFLILGFGKIMGG